MATALLTGYGGRKAYAACTAGAVGTYTCSSATNATQSLTGTPLTVTTDSSFSIDTTTTTGNAFTLSSEDGLTFTHDYTSTITGYETGIHAFNEGIGVLSITSTTGAVVGITEYGINAHNNDPSGTGLTIVTASVTGGKYGIFALNDGKGELSITSYDAVEGTDDSGIWAWNTHAKSTDLTINAIDVTGGAYAINAKNYGTGALSITLTGAVVGTNNNAIDATNYGTDLTIIAIDVTGGEDGINANNEGSGALS
ncbi:MAG: hypothetical protein GY814_14645, partial [Gammaproteobacteria bacterium]|nr:hypothetical protein [Gammaproteobacteria bacterium]